MRENRTVKPLSGGRAAGVAVAVALVASLGACGARHPTASPSDCPRPKGLTSVGEKIPTDCKLERLNGGTISFGQLVGKPAIINFWASWCTFCIAEMPDFQKVHAALGHKVTILGADLLDVDGETKALAKTFAARTGVTYSLLYDDGGILYGHFSAQLIMPVTIFVTAKGVVAFRQFGPLKEARIREILRTKLGIV